MAKCATRILIALAVLIASGLSTAGADGASSTMFLDPANDSRPNIERSTSEHCKALAEELAATQRAPLRRSELQRRYDDECSGRRTTTGGAGGSASGNGSR